MVGNAVDADDVLVVLALCDAVASWGFGAIDVGVVAGLTGGFDDKLVSVNEFGMGG